MKKYLRIFLPTIFGVITVWGLFKIEAIIHTIRFGSDDSPFESLRSDLLLIIIMICLGLIFQIAVTLPVYNRFKNGEKILNLHLVPFFALICIVGGLICGLLLWARQFGIKDFFISSAIGISSLASYWTINLLILNQLDKWRHYESG